MMTQTLRVTLAASHYVRQFPGRIDGGSTPGYGLFMLSKKVKRHSSTARFPMASTLFHRVGGVAPSSIRASLFIIVLLVSFGGCAKQACTFEIVDYRRPGAPQRYSETFTSAYYTLGAGGNADIVLVRSSPSEVSSGERVQQIIHLRSVWPCIPGETVADRAQINATISYYIMMGRVGAGFEGAGSLFFDEDPKTHVLSGSLEMAALKRTRRLSVTHDLFERAELSGTFHAQRNPHRVRRLINEMNRVFDSMTYQ